jgi:hypothetical protein
MTAPGTTTWDPFTAARWLDDLWNSRGRAVGPDLVEWECRTWGSGRGRGGWEQVVLFCVVAERFGLATRCNDDERDELVVEVPLGSFEAVAQLIDRLGEEPESWPWWNIEDDPESQLALAAEVLDLPVAELEANDRLRKLLRIEG